MRSVASESGQRAVGVAPPGRGRRGSRLLGGLLLLVVCAPVATLHVRHHRPLFVIDEFAYADYLDKVHHGQPFVRHGELTGQATLRALACRGFEPATWNDRPPCDAPSFDPAVFPNAGVNSADIHPPTYFLLTDVGARVLMGLGLTDDLVTAGRLCGAAWMAAGLLALWCLLREVGANRGASLIGITLVGASPFLLREWYYLTPDAADVLVGALVALAALRWERRGRGLSLLAGAGAMALAVKAPNMTVVLAVALYFLVRAAVGVRSGRAGDALEPARSAADYVRAAAAVVAGGVGAGLAWLFVRAALAIPGGVSPMDQDERLRAFTPAHLTRNLARFANVWDAEGSGTYPFAVIVSYVLMGSLLVALLTLPASERRRALALAVGVLVVFGPVLVVAVNWLVRGTYAPVEPRYGATLVPLQCALAATFWRSRASLAPLGALAVALPVAVLADLLSG